VCGYGVFLFVTKNRKIPLSVTNRQKWSFVDFPSFFGIFTDFQLYFSPIFNFISVVAAFPRLTSIF